MSDLQRLYNEVRQRLLHVEGENRELRRRLDIDQFDASVGSLVRYGRQVDGLLEPLRQAFVRLLADRDDKIGELESMISQLRAQLLSSAPG